MVLAGQGWTNATLTPNRNEFQRLADTLGICLDQDDPGACLAEVGRLPLCSASGVRAKLATCRVMGIAAGPSWSSGPAFLKWMSKLHMECPYSYKQRQYKVLRRTIL